MSSSDVSRDLDDFRRFLLLSLFRLRLYRTFEDNKPVYCVGLVVRCEDPGGWVAIWRRCYDNMEKASELYNAVEPLARNRLGNLVIMETYQPQPTD